MARGVLAEKIKDKLLECKDMSQVVRELQEEGHNVKSIYAAAKKAGIKKIFLLPEEVEMVMEMRRKMEGDRRC